MTPEDFINKLINYIKLAKNPDGSLSANSVATIENTFPRIVGMTLNIDNNITAEYVDPADEPIMVEIKQ